jgi:hypothetical protein
VSGKRPALENSSTSIQENRLKPLESFSSRIHVSVPFSEGYW